MNKITINVTLDDIRIGRRKDCWACPITRAIKRDFKRKAMVGEKIIFQDTKEEYMVSSDLYKWLLAFDNGEDVNPEQFIVKKLDKQGLFV